MGVEMGKGMMRCCYCRCPVTLDGSNDQMSATVDHVVPRSRGGSNHKTNKRIACKRCNNEKGDMLPAEYREFLERMASVSRFRAAAALKIRAEILGRRGPQ